MQNDARSALFEDRVAKLLELLPREVRVGTGIKKGGMRRVRRPKKRIGDDVDQVELRALDRAYQIARPRQEVPADVAQINADDDHHAPRRLLLRLFAHGILRSKTPRCLESTHRPCPVTGSPNIHGWVFAPDPRRGTIAPRRSDLRVPIFGLQARAAAYGLVTQRFAIVPTKGAVLPVASHGSVFETGGSWPNELFDVPASSATDGTPALLAVILCPTRRAITRCRLPSFTRPLVVTWLQVRTLSEGSM